MPSQTDRGAREGRAIPATTFLFFPAHSRRFWRVRLVVALSILCAGGGRAADARVGDRSTTDGGGRVADASVSDRSTTDGGGADGQTDGGLGDGGELERKADGGPADRQPDGALADGQAIRAQSSPTRVPDAGGAAATPSTSQSQAESPQHHAARDENHSVISARRVMAAAPREDRTASASVLIPADSPRARDDLGTLLLEVPGANITRTGGIGSFAAISLRGANPDEVRIYVDGIPLNQAVGGAVDLSTLPLGDVDRVEVYRGSTPMAFGQSALGGVVSVSTRTPAGTRASVRAGVGSFRTLSSDLTASDLLGRLRLYAGLHVLRAVGDFPDAPPSVPGGYQPPARENADLSQLDGVVRAVLPVGGRRELRAGFIGITRDQGLPAQNIFRSDARAATTRLLAHVDYESRDDLGASSRLKAAAFASATWDDFLDREHQIVGVPTATHDRSRLIGGSVTGEKAAGDWARISTLMEARAEDYLPRNDLDLNMPVGFPAHRSVGTAGTEVDIRSARLDLDVIPSVRLEASRDIRTGRDPAGKDLPQAQPIDRLLSILRLGGLRPAGGGTSFHGNIGRYARIPSFIELYGNNRGFVGSPGLRPERGVNADVGLSAAREGSAGSLAMSVTVFGSRVEDLIAWETYSAATRAENVSRARIWGVETELRLRGRRLSAITQATFTDARDRGDIASRRDRQLEHHPRYRGYARGEWRQRLGATAFAISGYAEADGTAGNFQTTGPYSAIPARLLLGAGLALEHAPTGLRLAASAFNLTDSRVEDFSNYPLPGRSFYIALGWSSAALVPAP